MWCICVLNACGCVHTSSCMLKKDVRCPDLLLSSLRQGLSLNLHLFDGLCDLCLLISPFVQCYKCVWVPSQHFTWMNKDHQNFGVKRFLKNILNILTALVSTSL